jgi:lysophospholipase L1-like esterase
MARPGTPKLGTLLAVLGLALVAVGQGACREDRASSEPPDDVRANRSEGITMSDGPREIVVILGASYAKGWNPGPAAGVEYVNKGVSGEQSHEMLARFDEDVVALKPRAVILWGYINDIHRGDRNRVEQIKERAKQSFERMVELARANGIEPILATEATLRGKDSWTERLAEFLGGLLGKNSYQDYVNEHVRELNVWLRGYAEQNGVFLLDLEPVLSDESGRRRPEYAREDGSHISAAGYDALTSHLAARLHRHFRASSSARATDSPPSGTSGDGNP